MIRAMHSSALSLLLALAVNGVLAHGQDPAPAPPAAQPVTFAQIFVTGDLGKNLERIRAAFAQAEREKAQWVFFFEGALSGYYDGFQQEEVAPAFAEVKELCRKTRLWTGMPEQYRATTWREGLDPTTGTFTAIIGSPCRLSATLLANDQ